MIGFRVLKCGWMDGITEENGATYVQNLINVGKKLLSG
jgi:hypothetical protein